MTRETVTRITTVLARYADLRGNMSAASLFGDLTPDQFRGDMEAVGVGTRPGVTDAFRVASGTGVDAPAGQVRYAWPSGSTFDGRDIRADADRWPLLVQSAETGLATVLAPTGAPVAEGVKTGAVLEVYGPVYPPGFFGATRSEEHTSELQSLMRISYAVFCLKQ